MLIEGKKAGHIAEPNTKGQPKRTDVGTLSEVGISRKEAAQYQQLARVPVSGHTWV